MKVFIACTEKIDKLNFDFDICYGVERGCLFLINNNLKIDTAISDFDSVSEKELNLIKNKSKNFIHLNSNKMYFDGEVAVRHAIKQGADVIYFACEGFNWDATLTLVSLIIKYSIKIICFNNNNWMELHDNEKKIIYQKPNYKYVSMVPIENSVITWKHFLYNCENLKLDLLSALGCRNEFIDSYGELIVKKGKILIIFSKV